MSGKIELQNLKALERAPQGTLAFRSYLLIRYSTILCNKAFGGLEINSLLSRNRGVKKGLMNELLTGRKKVKVDV